MADDIHFGRPIMSSIELVRNFWMGHGYVNFKERSSSPSKVIALAMTMYNDGDDETIISPKTWRLRWDKVYFYVR